MYHLHRPLTPRPAATIHIVEETIQDLNGNNLVGTIVQRLEDRAVRANDDISICNFNSLAPLSKFLKNREDIMRIFLGDFELGHCYDTVC